MKLSTARYLQTTKPENDGGNILDQARRILNRKINDIMWRDIIDYV